ncbi:MAG: PD-(D/E)XK nuclease family protein [Kiritimatiellae bacterium]|nr:PD-(D/E)XK nuclease family protein [Kiritimatiellia bacterium]
MESAEKVFLDPRRKPLDAMADWFASRARTDPSGAVSLAHILAVVPTAQSGRRLRLALARRFPQGLLPPRVAMPAQLLAVEGGEPAATRTDVLVAFWEARGGKDSFDVAAQLAEIRAVLASRALSFADVAGRIGDVLKTEFADAEAERWRGLAETEALYVAALKRRGKRDPLEATLSALASPVRPEGVEEAVVACVLDPLPLMEMALGAMGLERVTELLPGPLPAGESPLARVRIFPCATGASEAAGIAGVFGSVKPGEALPALCVADASLYPEIQGAMEAKGLKLHNPSSTPLSSSSLGHLASMIAALKRTSSYGVFSAFVRCGDVRRWLRSSLGMDAEGLVGALEELDRRQAQILPETVDDIRPRTSGALRNIFEFIAKELRKRTVRDMLKSIFSEVPLDVRNPASREFAAAALALKGLLDECFCESVPEQARLELFERRLGETGYSLEPDEGDAILADGWLELPYLDADELVISGMSEGCVPESVVGHAFLPDSLRRALSLPDNHSRALRDRRILEMALACRDASAVRVYFHSADAAGNALKPSRLLFEGVDDAVLAARAKRLYSAAAGTPDSPAADFPSAWRLRLPFPPQRGLLAHVSPSGMDEYLNCPFTYFLKKTFGERMDDRADELDPSEFGSLVHEALEGWALGELADSGSAPAIAADLSARVDAILGGRFGTAVPAIVALQGESAKRRLADFARIQAARRAQGWRIAASERRLEVMYGHTRIHGRCDRIDYNDALGEWCVIDYKTWDSAGRQRASLQLPLYCAMLDADPDPAFADAKLERISSAYCILGQTADDVCFSEPSGGELVPEAEMEVRRLIDRMERGIFWPPSTDCRWRYDFADWIYGSPAESVDPAWIADQERRIAGLDEAFSRSPR